MAHPLAKVNANPIHRVPKGDLFRYLQGAWLIMDVAQSKQVVQFWASWWWLFFNPSHIQISFTVFHIFSDDMWEACNIFRNCPLNEEGMYSVHP